MGIKDVMAQSTLTMMTYNIRYGTADDGPNQWDIRKDFLTHMLQYYEPHIIATQEGQKFQLDFIGKNLSDYKWFGLPRNREGWPEYCAIYYKSSILKLLKDSTIWLSPTPEVQSKGWDALLERIATMGLFQIIENSNRFWVINAHFDHIGTTARLESAKLLRSVAQSLKNEYDIPVILVGDFNDLPDSHTIQELKEYFSDASEISIIPPFGPPGTWNAFEFSRIPTEIIDYIFIDKDADWLVKKYRIIDDFYQFKYPSDHLPVMVHFQW